MILAGSSTGRKMPSVQIRPLSPYLFCPTPEPVAPYLAALSADPSDRTAAIGLGQWLTANPEYIKPIYRPDAVPCWFVLARVKVTMRAGDGRQASGVHFNNRTDGIVNAPGPIGVSTLFDREALIVEFPADALETVEELVRGWMMLDFPAPVVFVRSANLVIWFAPVPAREARF